MKSNGDNGWVINAVAPIRICDLGGWTDTWFAGTGTILNIGVYPYAEIQLHVTRTPPGQDRTITIFAENFGERYAFKCGLDYDRHPLLEASIDIMDVPADLSFEVNIYSGAPAGCSTGTSAAVAVALLGELDLLTPGRRTPHEVAALAHRVETEKLGLQCGIQDQLCSAYGGICFIEMFQYPYASVSQLFLPDSVWWELERRLVLVFLGKTHSSSEVHREVIAGLEQDGADSSALEAMRCAARGGKEALYAGDFTEYGKHMIANVEAQAALHEGLVSETARSVIALAQKHGAVGWKVNGAGGEGGSLTILLGPKSADKRAFAEALPTVGEGVRAIPIYLSRMGLRRWISGAPGDRSANT